MNIHDSNRKPVFELNRADFAAKPIWSWEEDDSNFVIPVPTDRVLSQDYDSLFIRADLTLHDGKRETGVVNVRMSDKSVYLISLFDIEGKLIDLPLQPALRHLKHPEKFAVILNKKVEDIFPLSFTTDFWFHDGRRLEGVINLT